MSERPEWMLPRIDVLRIEDRCYDANQIGAMIYRTGLRAQIAVLEEMVELFKIRSCPCVLQILAKIAALRKELEG